MVDDRPRGACVIPGCPRDPYPDGGRVPFVCGPCTSRMRHWLIEIPGLVAELSGGGYVMRDTVGERLELLIEDEDARSFGPVARYGPAPARLAREQPDHPLVVRAGLPVEHRDLVANVLPAGPMPGAARGGRVSGSAEPRLPINEDRTDLLAPARSSTAASAPLAYPEQDGDQVGFLPVAATLDGLAEGLRLHRRRAGEQRPFPAVTNLCTWLLDRLDDACADWPGIGEFFDEVRLAHDALRGQLGRIDVPDYKKGTPCSKCSALALIRQAGGDWVICSACGSYLKITEYEEYVTMLATQVSAEEREKRRKAAADLRAARRAFERLPFKTEVAQLAHFALDKLWAAAQDPDVPGCCHECCAPCASLVALDRLGVLDEVLAAWPDGVDGSDIFPDGQLDREWMYRQWSGSPVQESCGHRFGGPDAVLALPKEQAA